MNEGQDSELSAAAAPQAGADSAGALLRQARQDSGAHIATLAAMLKVPVAKLEALEADNYAALPDIVFARALAASVCRILKIDPAPVLALLPQGQNPRLVSERAPINAPVRGSAVGPGGNPYSGAGSRWVSGVILVLLVAALLLYFYPRQRGAGNAPGAPPAFPASAAPAHNPADSAAQDAAGAPLQPAPDQASAPAPAPPASAAASAPVAAPAAGAASEPLLVLRARSETWVRVRDASGALAAQRTLAAGEAVTVAADAPRPLEVVIGRANAAEVLVHGKPFAIGAVTRDNVARFEVK